jgi:hypothetical protein
LFPASLTLTIGLETPLDLETAHVGDLISAKVQSAVKHKGVVIVPKGALVSGRLRRLEKYTDESPYFVVGLEFSEVDFPRESCPLLCGVAADHSTGSAHGLEDNALQ